jgi:hypothetical protein
LPQHIRDAARVRIEQILPHRPLERIPGKTKQLKGRHPRLYWHGAEMRVNFLRGPGDARAATVVERAGGIEQLKGLKIARVYHDSEYVQDKDITPRTCP